MSSNSVQQEPSWVTPILPSKWNSSSTEEKVTATCFISLQRALERLLRAAPIVVAAETSMVSGSYLPGVLAGEQSCRLLLAACLVGDPLMGASLLPEPSPPSLPGVGPSSGYPWNNHQLFPQVSALACPPRLCKRLAFAPRGHCHQPGGVGAGPGPRDVLRARGTFGSRPRRQCLDGEERQGGHTAPGRRYWASRRGGRAVGRCEGASAPAQPFLSRPASEDWTAAPPSGPLNG